jgi:hypothetical protein
LIQAGRIATLAACCQNRSPRQPCHAKLELGAFTWSRIQRLYDPDATAHWQRCEAEGLQCPQEAFTQLFHEQSNNEDFAVIVRSIDWGRVRWELQEISGIAMRHVRVAREYFRSEDCRGSISRGGDSRNRAFRHDARFHARLPQWEYFGPDSNDRELTGGSPWLYS